MCTYNGHVEPFNITAKLVWRQLIFICYIEVESAWTGGRDRFDVIHLLITQ
jgi:hypothetical protein